MHPKKRFSQNFLTSAEIRAEILQFLCLSPEDHIFEVGPGQGFLTEKLLEQNHPTWGVEIDRDLCKFLKKKFPLPHFHLFEQDILQFDFSKFFDLFSEDFTQKKWKLVANLPYHISSPFLFLLYQQRHHFDLFFLLLQKEVGERFCSQIGVSKPKNLGVLGLLGELGFEFEKEIFVPRQVFYPKPKVDSLGLVFRAKKDRVPFSFFDFAKRMYQHRRKTLHNNPLFFQISQNKAVNPSWKSLRPEELRLENWLELFSFFELLKNQNFISVG